MIRPVLGFQTVDPSTFATTIASQGLLGVMLVIVAYVAWRKDKDLQEERDERIADAKSYNELALKLQAQVIESVNKLGDILEQMKQVVAARR
jgi:hypothetical protein